MDAVAERIKAVREAKRIKQNEIAASLGIDSSNYAKLEKRGAKMSFEQLADIANALDIGFLDLLDPEYIPDKGEREKDLEKQIIELDQENIELNRIIKALTDMAETLAKKDEALAKKDETIADLHEQIKRYNKELEKIAQDIITNFDDPSTKGKVILFFQMYLDHPIQNVS